MRQLVKAGVTIAALAATCLSSAVATQAPEQRADAAPRTGLIVGRVVDATSGAAIGDAIVQLARQGTIVGRVMADPDGRFFFSELAPGSYFIEATKDGYSPGRFGQRRAWGPSLPLTLAAGQRLADVDLRVWKHAVVGGSVVDEFGEPIVGITVRALVKDAIGGRTSYGNDEFHPDLAPTATTDDRGTFRLARLTPGTFVVVVPSTHATVPARASTELSTPLRNELFRAGVHEIAPPGEPRTLTAGDVALLTLRQVPIPPAPAPDGAWRVYPTTFYPAARSAAAATPITVRAGEERLDLAISLRPVTAVRVSGRVRTPEGGAPSAMTLKLTGDALDGVVSTTGSSGAVGMETATTLTDPNGRFTFLGVPSGNYMVSQANPFLIAVARQSGSAYWLTHPLTVGRTDVTNLEIELRPALRLEGRIELQASQTASPRSPPLPLVVFETPFGEPGQVAAEGDRETLTFATVAAGRRFIVRPVETGGWFVHSVTLDGKDITDRAFDLTTDATSIVITYTDRPSRLTGRVTDAEGSPDANAVVFVFPVDQTRWTGTGKSPRLLKSALTTRAGDFAFEHLPPGTYHVIAVDAAGADGWKDPARLEALASQATRVSIEADRPVDTVDLKVRAIER